MKAINVLAKLDTALPAKHDDPRIRDGKKLVKIRGAGRNTESFDPKSTIVRPEMRILVQQPTAKIQTVLKHDDVVVVPNFFCAEDDWTIYYKLIEEVRALQESQVRDSDWISWAEGAHLITKNTQGSPTAEMLFKKICDYMDIDPATASTRFNWYRDSSDWKPFHHDSAAFNAERARKQNITVGISFGSTRELAFLHADNKTKIYFPQTNGMLFAFGRDVNIRWKHGINALPESEQDGLGRVSIILWGLCKNVKEESGSPALLTDNTRGNGYSMHRGGDRDVCRDFQKGLCSRGDTCRWLHSRPGDVRRPLEDRRVHENRRSRSRSRSRSRERNHRGHRDYRDSSKRSRSPDKHRRRDDRF